MKCYVCSLSFETESYDDNTCPNCGQQYEYDESQMLVLSEEQRQALLKINTRSIK